MKTLVEEIYGKARCDALLHSTARACIEPKIVLLVKVVHHSFAGRAFLVYEVSE